MAMPLDPGRDERGEQPLLLCRTNDPGCRHQDSKPLIVG